MKNFFYRNIKRIMPTALIMCIFFAHNVSYAVVRYTDRSYGEYDSVYIAGNPDMFPFEYYDEETKTMKGVIPEMMKRVSRETGIDFIYVGAGKTNRQHGAAKNRQAEILTCYVPSAETDEHLKSKVTVTKLGEDASKDIYVAFTDIADDKLVSAVTREISRLRDDEIMKLIVNESVSSRGYKMPLAYRMIIILAVEMALVLLIILTVLRGENKRRANNEKNRDEATGIGNRMFFRERYEENINENIRNLYYLAYISFDLKRVNSYYGEQVADNVIRKAAEIITRNVREKEFVARLYGGTFGLCFTANNANEAGVFISSLLEYLNEIEKQDGLSEEGSFHAGIYYLGNKDWAMERALYCADNACRYAKDNNLSYFLSTAEKEAETEKAWKINSGIMSAIEKNEFLPYIQFIISPESGEMKGAEMLSRWKHPTEGLLNPYRYIETMERMGSIVELDYHIFENTCRRLQEWGDRSDRDFFAICNLRKLTVSEKNFTDKITEISDRYSFRREKLVIGLVEDMREHLIETVSENIGICRKLGFRIMVDNIGYGASSLSDICELKADMMRISRDKLGKGGDPSCLNFIKAIATMGHSLGMEVLLDGVENEEYAELAEKIDCDYVQGAFYGVALPSKEIESFIAGYEKPEKNGKSPVKA